MAIVTDMSGAITALYKFYHADRTRFYPTVDSAGEYPDEMYAVTLAPNSAANTAQSCMVRFVRSSGGTWMTKKLLDVTDTAAVGVMSSVVTGQFARMAGKTYYTNGEDAVMQVRSRQSSQDTAAKFLYPAGIPDPNAVKKFDTLDTTGSLTH
jgi:hypothetical protein